MGDKKKTHKLNPPQTISGQSCEDIAHVFFLFFLFCVFTPKILRLGVFFFREPPRAN